MKKTIQILLMILIVTLLMPVVAGCSSNCEIMIDSGEIFTEAYGGECTMIYSQKYSSESGSWSEINCNTILYPMTDG